MSGLFLLILLMCHSLSVSRETKMDKVIKIKSNIDEALRDPARSRIRVPIPESARKGFLDKTYGYYTKKSPVYVVTSSLSQMEFGNHFGRIVNELACAYKAGLHAIVVHQKYDILFNDENSNAGSKFVNELCGVHIHPNPVKSIKNAVKVVERDCKCEMYCWEDDKAPWVDFIVPLRQIFQRGLTADSFNAPLWSNRQYEEDNYDRQNHPISSSMTITTSSETHMTSVITNTELDLIPSIAIQFRCSDNFRHNMGLLPFPAIFERLDFHWASILQKVKSRPPSNNSSSSLLNKVHIYIMTEHPYRLSGAPLHHICPVVISTLQKALSRRYEDSIVSIQRGMMFQTWFQFTKADLVICSASSFCLWPGLGNSDGTVYLPKSTLFANKTTVNFGVKNVHFIENFELFGVDGRTMNASYVVNSLLKGTM